MKTNNSETAPNRNLAEICLASCQKLIAQIKETKDRILTEFQDRYETHEQLLRLALNEAEALAWQTPYPQLVFPDLAVEKAQAVAAWSSHQRSIRHAKPALAISV